MADSINIMNVREFARLATYEPRAFVRGSKHYNEYKSCKKELDTAVRKKKDFSLNMTNRALQSWSTEV